MSTTGERILDAALRLSEDDRMAIVSRLLETLPDDVLNGSDDDPGFLEELERRANDSAPTVPLSELWKQGESR